MIKRNYKLQDIKDFLKEYYNLDWRHFYVLDNGKTRSIRLHDFKQDRLFVGAIVYKGEKARKIRFIDVTNYSFDVHGEKNLNYVFGKTF